MAKIAVRSPGSEEAINILNGNEIRIGRGVNCQIVLADGTVSREHCLLKQTPCGFRIYDLGGRNGTILNGKVLQAEVLLRTGDIIRVGKTDILYVCAPGEFEEAEPSGNERRLPEELSTVDSRLSTDAGESLSSSEAKAGDASAGVRPCPDYTPDASTPGGGESGAMPPRAGIADDLRAEGEDALDTSEVCAADLPDGDYRLCGGDSEFGKKIYETGFAPLTTEELAAIDRTPQPPRSHSRPADGLPISAAAPFAHPPHLPGGHAIHRAPHKQSTPEAIEAKRQALQRRRKNDRLARMILFFIFTILPSTLIILYLIWRYSER